MSKLVNIDGRFYDMKISPAGDKLTLEPSPLPLGNVTNPNGGFRAVIYGDDGLLKIRGDKDTPAAVPEGEWKLLSYTIEFTETEPAEKAGGEEARGRRARLAKSLESLFGGPAERRSPRAAVGRHGRGDRRLQGGQGRQGRNGRASLRPAVQAHRDGRVLPGPARTSKVLSLGMSLVGSAGEVCSDMTVNGGRPSKPEFTITDPKGKVVQAGQFRVWLRFHLPVLVASTIGTGQRISRPRQDEGRSVCDRRKQRQRDPSQGHPGAGNRHDALTRRSSAYFASVAESLPSPFAPRK